jgi:hypothetical protein
MISYEALLPNLRYKKKDKNIYYIHKNPIKITLNGKTDYKKEFLLEDVYFNGNIYCIDTEINFSILEKEDDEGLIVNIKYRDAAYIYKQDMQKFARAIEAFLLGIDIMEDNDSYEDSYYSYDNNYSYYASSLYDDNSAYDDNSSYDNESFQDDIKSYDDVNSNYEYESNFGDN